MTSLECLVYIPGEELFEANVALEVAEKDVRVLDVHPQDVHRLVTLRAGQIKQSSIYNSNSNSCPAIKN